ncbi:Retrovirus-related Pol polyprotein from transposon 17.6 [Araneus ventricosus]|uniref:RNA-directed DNA polymerase n=1 Tax=Araneus ventricosus TaxID=182803 RepID=A0A4Y2TYP2_ARAVE|nr:Retrovirus-related Pol polyprotein from transposon 17.6 [Araneus ventricosus]
MNVIPNSLLSKLKCFEIEGPPVELKTITGLVVYSDLIIKSKVNINGVDFDTHLVVAGSELSNSFNLILSLNFFNAYEFVLDCKNSVLKNNVVSKSWKFTRFFPNCSNHIHTNENAFSSNSNDTFDQNENDENTSNQKSFIGKVFKKVKIPANSQQYINIKLDNVDNNMSVGQPLLIEKLDDQHADSFLIARPISKLEENNKCLALICNLSNSPVNLNKNMSLVQISPIQCSLVENVNNVSTSKVGKQIDWATQIDLSHLKDEQKLKVMDLLSKYNSVFAQDIAELGVCDLIEHEIHLTDQIPTRQKPYRVPYNLKPEMKKQINLLLEAGIIQPSKSPFCAPVLLVKKADNSYRLVADLRKLNSKTIPDNFPLPNLTEMIDGLSGAKYFSTLDLTSGFHQMVMHPDHTKYTAIATEFGLYEYKCLPFGLKNASASFQRLMNLVLAGLNEFHISCYIDDLVIASQDFETHIKRLQMVFDRLIQANLKVKPSKCSFLRNEISYLGHTIKEGQVFPDKKNLDSIKKALPPKNRKQVRSFLGLTGFYRKFIPNYSKVALPLTELTKDTTKFEWSEREQLAFEELKNYLISEPCLALPDFSKPFSVFTDASKYALGAVLVQEDETKFHHPISFASRKLSDAETRYSVVEREAMAIVFALNHFKNYLFGKHFTVYSDQQCLSKILKLKDPNSRIARWMLTLQQFDYTVIHKPGRLNQMADYLSRAKYPKEENVSVEQPDINTLELNSSTFVCNSMPVSEIIQKQNCDSYFNNIKNKLKSNFIFSPKSPKFFIKDDLLLCHTNTKNRHSHVAKLVVPQTLVPQILNLAHDNDACAHPGLTRTLKRIKQNYFWHKLYSQVKRYIGSCHSCIQRRGFHKNFKAPIQKIPTADYPFQKVAFDAIGPLVTSKHGNKWIIVMSDYFTRYAEAYALPNIQSSNVARVLIDFISRHGIMQVLYSDRGSNFLSQAMQEVYNKLGISKQQTLSYSPQGNGLVERLNKTLIDSLSHLVSENQEDWCEHLPFALMAFRNACHSTTNESPNFLVYGRDPVMPYHLIYSEKIRSY